MDRLCLAVSNILTLVVSIIIFSKIGYASTYKDKKRKKAAYANIIMYISGFLSGILFCLGIQFK